MERLRQCGDLRRCSGSLIKKDAGWEKCRGESTCSFDFSSLSFKEPGASPVLFFRHMDFV